MKKERRDDQFSKRIELPRSNADFAVDACKCDFFFNMKHPILHIFFSDSLVSLLQLEIQLMPLRQDKIVP